MKKTLRYTKGWKYQTDQTIGFKLHNKFTIKPGGYKNQYYSISEDGVLVAYRGCCWDGATWFPDFEWMMIPSLIHDILHWLIAKGVIPESENDLIDKELVSWVAPNSNRLKVLAARRLIKRATNLVDQRVGQEKKVYEVIYEE